MTMLLFSRCLASEPSTKYFSKGLKVFTELIATDLEEDDFLEIMNYIGSRFHWHYCDKRIQTLLDTTDQHEKEIQRLSAEQVDNKEQLRSEISQVKLDLDSKFANASKVRDNEIREALMEQNNQFKQAFCDFESFESCLSGDCCFEQTVTYKNMALGKTAWQSSSLYPDEGEATAAVDGNRNTDWHGRSCFHTNIEDHPWWMVDLGAEKHIGRVVMVNRGDGSYERLNNLVVSVSLEMEGDSVTCGTFQGPGVAGQVITITCSEEIRGRFVKLTMNSRNFFHLCEVEVYRN